MVELNREEIWFHLEDYELPRELGLQNLSSMGVNFNTEEGKILHHQVSQNPQIRAFNAATIGRLTEAHLRGCEWDEDMQKRVWAINLSSRANSIEGQVAKEERHPSYQWVSGFNLGRVISSLVDGYREVQRLRFQARQLLGGLPPISSDEYKQIIEEIAEKTLREYISQQP